MNRIKPRHDLPKHIEQQRWIRNLIVDLKLQLLNQEPQRPITMERLNEWNALERELDECRERQIFY